MELPLKWRMLTDGQKSKIANGCGAKGGWIPVPDFFMRASCDHHDFNYWVGGTKDDRWRADYQFFCAMKGDVEELPWWKKPVGWLVIRTYYRAVRIFGRKWFHLGTYRTWADLEECMKGKKI